MIDCLFIIYVAICAIFEKGDYFEMQQHTIPLKDSVGLEIILPSNTRLITNENRNSVEFDLPFYEEFVYFGFYKESMDSNIFPIVSPFTAKKKAEISFKEMFNALLTKYYFIPPNRLEGAASVGYDYESIFPRLPMQRHVEYFVKYQQDIYCFGIITEPDYFERLRPVFYSILRSIRFIDISDLQEKHSNEALY